jgi:uncharacterized ion transporter superfamily protein YfcC
MRYNPDQDKLGGIGWACLIFTLLLIIGVVWIFIHAAKVEKRIKEESRPQPLAEKWQEYNNRKYNL